MLRFAKIGALVVLAGCAQPVSKIAPEVTSAARYDGWRCSRLRQEQTQLGSDLAAASKTQKRAVATDVMMVFLIGVPLSGGGVPDRIARLKGRQIVLQNSLQGRGCL